MIGSWAPVGIDPAAFAQTCACAPEGGASQGYLIQADEPPPPLPEYDQPPLPLPAIIGRPATGHGTTTITTGYPARGWSRLRPGCCGPPATGLSWAASTPFGPATGASISDFTAESITDSAITAPAILAADGTTGAFTIERSTISAAIIRDHLQPGDHQRYEHQSRELQRRGGRNGRRTNKRGAAGREGAHVRPTELQFDQARAASMRGEQFVSTNRGRPAIAATPRPGEFKGKGVVPAKAEESRRGDPRGPGAERDCFARDKGKTANGRETGRAVSGDPASKAGEKLSRRPSRRFEGWRSRRRLRSWRSPATRQSRRSGRPSR